MCTGHWDTWRNNVGNEYVPRETGAAKLRVTIKK